MMMLMALAWATPVSADSSLPEPTSRRVILHGVDCSIDDGTVCNDDRPVFDEALGGVPDTGVVVIRMQVLEALGGEPTSTLQGISVEAVREYFIEGGINPGQVDIQGCTDALVLLDGMPPLEVQLSKSF
jgi:hypothetical protein